MATKKEDGTSLINYFLKKYKEQYGTTPTNFNRYAKKWGFTDMFNDLGYNRSSTIIDYFFELSVAHDADTLLKNYGNYNEAFEEAEKDKAKRAELAEETKRRVAEYRANRNKS